MASGRLLRQLIQSGVEGDTRAFRLLSEEVIKEEREKQHHLLANDLEKVLYGRPVTVSPQRHLSQVPMDKDRDAQLIVVNQPTRGLADVVLTPSNSQSVESLLLEHRKSEVLRSHGLRPADRVLLVGPPGCGKTLLAEAMAFELDRLFAVVRLDSVVSSYLGETASNLRKIFDYIAGSPMVVLFDEFDAISKERASKDEHGELKRVVSAVLQMFDDYRGKSILVAATNHEAMLDTAVWRRFDEVLQLRMPLVAQMREVLALKLRGARRDFELDDPSLGSLFKGYSYAGVERVVRHAMKTMVLQGRQFLTLMDLKTARDRDKHRLSQ